MSSRTPAQKFPRVSGLSSKEAQDRVNALLAHREEQDRNVRKECRSSGIPGPPKPSFEETIRVTYLSSRLLSVDSRYTSFGCAPYPDIDIPNSLTIDLVQGQELNWDSFFVDGFLREGEHGSPLTKLYLRHARLDDECSKVLDDYLKASQLSYDMWFNKQRGLMVEASFPHVVRECGKLVSIPFSEIQDSIRDPDVRRELLSSSPPAK
jgi:hypothetical protein